MGGITAVVPLEITSARRATSCSPPTSTVCRSVSFPSPRKSLAPVASSAAAGPRGSESPGASCFGQGLARANQRLGGNATPVGALAPDQLALDHGERQPAVPQAVRDRLSRDATAETYDIELAR